jgi:hypothetical protein
MWPYFRRHGVENEAMCLVCSKTNKEIPLLTLIYQEKICWICPQHLPILIHKPEELVGLLPGAKNLSGHED